IRPRSRRALPDPGLAPEGTLEVARLAFAMPTDAPTRFEGEARAVDFAFHPGVDVDRLEGPVTVSGTIADRTLITLASRSARFRVESYPFSQADVDVEFRPRGTSVT